MTVYIPGQFLAVLKIRAEGERKSLSAYIRRLLMVHSTPPKRKVKAEGELVKVDLTMTIKLWERMGKRAKYESTNLSHVLVSHAAKEFAIDGESS